MPRYVVERTFPEGVRFAAADAEGYVGTIERNEDEDVTWLHSYVSADRRKSFCIYEGPTPEAIRKAASRNDLPVDQITEVRVLDPYAYSI